MEVRPMSKELSTHLQDHIETWPATKEDIVQACSNMSDIPETERRWVQENMPEGLYHTPEEAEMALQHGAAQG
jgi:hypothetical protein